MQEDLGRISEVLVVRNSILAEKSNWSTRISNKGRREMQEKFGRRMNEVLVAKSNISR